MSRGVKITLIVVAVVLVLCCAGGAVAFLVGGSLFGRAVSQAVVQDPAQAAKVGHEIVDYTLPPGYQEVFAMNMVGIKMVAISQPDKSGDTMALMLMQFPATSNLDQEQMEQQMQQAWSQQSQRGTVNMQVVGTQKVTIRGQSVMLTVSEGTSGSSDATTRQVTGVFTGKGGFVMLMAMGDKNRWDQTALDTFLASIK
jgi:hypothetical protein